MRRLTKSILLCLCISLLVAAADRPRLTGPSLSQLSSAAAQSSSGCLPPLIPCNVLPVLPTIPSTPLVHVNIPSRDGQKAAGAPMAGQSVMPVVFRLKPLASTSAQACSPITVDLKILIITTDPTDTNTALPAIKQALDYQGTPYTVFTASPRPSDPTTDRLAPMLSSGCHGNFEGIILGNGDVAYNDPTAGWVSALTNNEWQSLYTYERTYGIRQATWYTFPSSQYGFNPPSSSGDTTANPISAQYNGASGPVFGLYANTANPLTIQNVWAYKATPLDGNTSPLLSDSSGNALVAIRSYSDGTQNLAMTFDGNPNVIHTEVLAYGVVNWVANGLFLGERHIFMTPQEDDILIDDHVWAEGTACGTNPESTPVTYRISGNDLQAFINWQTGVQSQATTHGFKLAHAFVGEGTTGYSPDTLTPAIQANQAKFNWINHTLNHTNLDNTNYNTTMSEITQNDQVAQQMGFASYTIKNLITPDVSGLNNANAMQAAYDAGVRYVVSDTSIASGNNPAPNIGIYNQYQHGILEIPRHPDNLFYNVSNPEQWLEEYNCFYNSFYGRNLTYPEILNNESNVLLHYVMIGDMDPWMFHQTNLRAYDGSHALLGDLFDQILTKYDALFVLPVQDPTMDNLGVQIANRMAYSSAGVTASIVPGQSITITSQGNAVVPVTGLNGSGAENYGGQFISHVSMSAGQTVTIPFNSTPPTPTPSPTPSPTNTPTNTPLPTNTPTLTPTPTNTPLPTNTPTQTPTPTSTSILPTVTLIVPSPTATATNTPKVNTPPVASNDSYSMHTLDVTLTVQAPGVLANDTDSDGDVLTAVLLSGPSKGALSLNADGSFTYTPLPSLTSFTDTFIYKAFDGVYYSNVATVTIQVTVP